MSEPIPCPRCGRENEPDATNCIRCGIDLSEGWVSASPEPEPPKGMCHRHPKIPTNLSCGRCERLICTKCAVIGPNGVRCRECARQNVTVRPAALAYEARRSVLSLFRGGPFSIWIMIMMFGFVFFMIRSCAFRAAHPPIAPSIEREALPRPTNDPGGLGQ